MGLVEYELPFVRIGLQWALALGLAVYWRLFTLYRKWAMVRPPPASLLGDADMVGDRTHAPHTAHIAHRWA
jgi:hypothetical protein